MVMSLLDLLEREKTTVENIKRAESIIERYKQHVPDKDKSVRDFFQPNDLKSWYYYSMEKNNYDPPIVTYDMYAVYIADLIYELDEIQNQIALYFGKMKEKMKIVTGINADTGLISPDLLKS